MSRTYIPIGLRNVVIERAEACCEYCLVSAEIRGLDFAIDHVIAEKHGGPTQLDNLCYACFWCNSYKGSDICSVDWDNNNTIVPLFNPREHNWNQHFRLDGLRIVPLTPSGRVTTSLLRLNEPERIKERRVLIGLGVYPCIAQLDTVSENS